MVTLVKRNYITGPSRPKFVLRNSLQNNGHFLFFRFIVSFVYTLYTRRYTFLGSPSIRIERKGFSDFNMTHDMMDKYLTFLATIHYVHNRNIKYL